MRKQHIPWMAALAALSIVAAACGDSDNDTADTKAPASNEAPAGSDGAATTGGADKPAAGSLRAWGWSSSATEDGALTSLLKEYGESSGINVTFEPQPEYETALQASLAAGDPPDFFYVDSSKLPDLADAGALAPVPEGAVTDPDDIYPALKDAFTYDGTWYCPPKDFSTLGLIYDKAAFAEAGLEPPTTMDELAAAAEKLTTPDRAGLVLGPELARAGVFMLANGGYITNDEITEMTLDTDSNRESLQFLADMFASGSASTPAKVEADWSGAAFGQGKAAMIIEGNWVVGFLAENHPDREYGVVEVPAGSAGKATFAFTVCYGVGAESATADTAWKAIDYLTGPEGAKKWTDKFNVMPARQSLAAGWLEGKPELKAFVDGAEYAQPWRFVPGFTDVVTEFNSQFEKLIAGDATVDELITAVTEAGESVL
jgi:multiple sugar transport system substrate-binding protein